jgi:hypothetical protein
MTGGRMWEIGRDAHCQGESDGLLKLRRLKEI